MVDRHCGGGTLLPFPPLPHSSASATDLCLLQSSMRFSSEELVLATSSVSSRSNTSAMRPDSSSTVDFMTVKGVRT